MALELFGPAANMQCGTIAQRDRRQASAQEAKSLRRYGGLPFAEWFTAKDFSPEKARSIASQHWRYAQKTGRTTAETLDAWCAEVGIPVPPMPSEVIGRKKPGRPVNGECLAGQVKAAAKADPWVAWLLLIAGRQIPTNPNELNFRLEFFP